MLTSKRGRTPIIAGLLALALLACGGKAWAKDRATGGHGTAAVIAAIDAYNRGDIGFAYRALRAEAERGDSDAQVNLGYLFARGQGVRADQLEAFRLYALSAKQGNGEGMNALGFKYEHGTGIRPDAAKAVHWYCLAIARGNPRAMNNLALMLDAGKAVPKDRAEARSLWQQAAALDHVNAMYNLGVSYLADRDLPADPAEGQRWIFAAARRGHGGAAQLMRRFGYTGPLPQIVDFAAQMELQPRDAAPGHAAICGDLIS